MTNDQLVILFVLGPAAAAGVIVGLLIWVGLALDKRSWRRRQSEMAAELEALDRRNAAARSRVD